MAKPTMLQKKLWTILIFLLKFIALALPLHLILWINMDTTPIQELTASNTYHILSLFRQDVTLDGIMIITSTYAFEFVRDCTAWKSMLAFAALVIAAPTVTARSRSIALLWGLPSIYALNLIRTSTTILVGIRNPALFDVVHTLFWREGLILIIFAMWLGWFVKNRSPEPESYGFLNKIIVKINRDGR